MLDPEPNAAPHRSPDESLERVVVLIPARDTGRNLVSLVESLLQLDFHAIVVVNDGSSSGFYKSLEPLKDFPRVHLLHHAVNLGKGRALKTGMNFALSTFPLFDVLVTADADGQHTPHDIEHVARAALHSQGQVVLGSREFVKYVPLRSRVGNKLTRYIFAIVTGRKLKDTQTGLRAFPRSLLPKLTELKGERYEYEMTVLLHLFRAGHKPLELPIETIYIEDNRSSHFDPVRDSMRIYFVLARYFLLTIIAAAADFSGSL